MDPSVCFFSQSVEICYSVEECEEIQPHTFWGFPGGSGVESTCQAGDAGAAGSNHGSGRFPGEGNGNLLQYFCLRNLMTDGPGGLQSMGSQRVRPMTERLNHHHHSDTVSQ